MAVDGLRCDVFGPSSANAIGEILKVVDGGSLEVFFGEFTFVVEFVSIVILTRKTNEYNKRIYNVNVRQI